MRGSVDDGHLSIAGFEVGSGAPFRYVYLVGTVLLRLIINNQNRLTQVISRE